MTASSRKIIDLFVETGVACSERDVLPEAMDSLFARLRAVAGTECEPPDLDGLCMACGRKVAEPVGKDKHGCNPLSLVIVPVARMRRLAVRCGRLGRLMWAAARARRTLRGRR